MIITVIFVIIIVDIVVNNYQRSLGISVMIKAITP